MRKGNLSSAYRLQAVGDAQTQGVMYRTKEKLGRVEGLAVVKHHKPRDCLSACNPFIKLGHLLLERIANFACSTHKSDDDVSVHGSPNERHLSLVYLTYEGTLGVQKRVFCLSLESRTHDGQQV